MGEYLFTLNFQICEPQRFSFMNPRNERSATIWKKSCLLELLQEKDLTILLGPMFILQKSCFTSSDDRVIVFLFSWSHKLKEDFRFLISVAMNYAVPLSLVGYKKLLAMARQHIILKVLKLSLFGCRIYLHKFKFQSDAL